MTTTSLACRKLTALLDKVNAERLKREFKSFRAFMKELDDSKPAGDQGLLQAFHHGTV